MVNFILGLISGMVCALIAIMIIGRDGRTWTEPPETDEFKEQLLSFWRQSVSFQAGNNDALEDIAEQLNRIANKEK